MGTSKNVSTYNLNCCASETDLNDALRGYVGMLLYTVLVSILVYVNVSNADLVKSGGVLVLGAYHLPPAKPERTTKAEAICPVSTRELTRPRPLDHSYDTNESSSKTGELSRGRVRD